MTLMLSNNPQSESSKPSTKLIEIAKIRRDGGTQPRAQLYEEVVAEYSEDMKQGAEFPPVTVFFDGDEYWLADGFHRVKAKEKIGGKKINAEVHLGTQRDAVLYAVGANAIHGLRRTNADKHRAVVRLLRDREWCQWSNREIAKQCQVHEKTVRNVRKQLGAENPHLDIDPVKRIALRKGTLVEIDTTNIGNKPPGEVNKPTKRRRTKKQPISPKPLVSEPKEVARGDTWKLGKSHYLFCGDPDSAEFQKLLPSEIALLLFFPRKPEPWLPKKPENVQNTLLFHTSYGDDIDLKNLRQVVENCISTTTDSDDPVVIINLPDPSLFILMEQLFCPCYCADPDPQRCADALTAWAIIKLPTKKL